MKNAFFVYFFSLAVLLVLGVGFGDSYNPDFSAAEARGLLALGFAWEFIQLAAYTWQQHGKRLSTWWRTVRQHE